MSYQTTFGFMVCSCARLWELCEHRLPPGVGHRQTLTADLKPWAHGGGLGPKRGLHH